MDVRGKRLGRMKASAFVVFSLSATAGIVDAFHLPKVTIPLSLSRSSTSLATSLSTPPSIMRPIDDGDDDVHIFHETLGKSSEASIEPEKESDPFYRYLRTLIKKIKSVKTRALVLDDELKRLEIRYYNLTGDDSPRCTYAASNQYTYKGPLVRPDDRCYSLVCNSYSAIGKRGAHLAEEVLRRYEKHGGDSYNSRLLTGVMKAWAFADDWDKADFWLMTMENRYKETGDPNNAPKSITYSLYIKALSSSKKLETDAAEKSLEILDKMRDLYISGENAFALPTRFTYSSVMKCQERAFGGVKAVERVEDLYRQLEDDYKVFGGKDLKPAAIDALPVFTAVMHRKGSTKAAKYAENILQELQLRYEETGDINYRPTEIMYASLLSTYAKVSAHEAKRCSLQADKLLDAMKRNKLKPSAHTITSAINAKVNYKCKESVIQAEKLMRSLENPDLVAYKCVIKAYCRVGNARKADSLIQEVKNIPDDKLKTAHNKARVEVLTLGACIAAYSKQKGIHYALERSEYYLNEIINKYKEGEVEPYEQHVDSWVFEAVGRLWSRSRKRDAGERVESLINKMENLNKEVVPGLFRPTLNMYFLALDAWASSGRGDAGKNAMALLRKMKTLHKSGMLDEPNNRALSSVFTSVINSPGKKTLKTAETLYQQILERYQRGDRSDYVNKQALTSLLSAIFRSNVVDAETRALAVLRQIVKLGKQDPDIAPGTIAFNSCLSGFAKRGAGNKAWALLEEMQALYSEGYRSKPDSISYACVARALSSSVRIPLAMERLDKLTMVILHETETGVLKPDTQLFNAVINSYSVLSKLDPKAASKASDLLMNLELSSVGKHPVAPDLLTFQGVCHAYAMCRDPESAEETLNRAKLLAAKGRLPTPGTELYTSVLLAHTRSRQQDSLEKASKILEQMEALYNGGHKEAGPNTYAYDTLLSAYANSRGPQRVEIANGLFAKLYSAFEEGRKECQPSVNSFNWMILAAARYSPASTQEMKETFEVALHYFKLLHTHAGSAKPNSATYEFFLEACYRILPEGETRKKLARKAFELCIQRGLVTARVCREAFKSDPNLVLKGLNTTLKSEMEGMAVIPESWCNRVPKKRRSTRVELNHNASDVH